MSDKIIQVVRDEASQTSPDLIRGYTAARTPRTIVHDLIGGDTDVSLQVAQLRSGTLDLFYMDKADADAALELLARAEVFRLATQFSAAPIYSIPFFAVTDGLSIELEASTEGQPANRQRWIVSVTYQELADG